MIVNYSANEIEHTFYLFPFAKIKVIELKCNADKNIENSIEYYHYLFIVRITEFWLSKCLPDEIEIITMRYFENKSLDYIAIQLGYKNHSSIIRKVNVIIKKLSQY